MQIYCFVVFSHLSRPPSVQTTCGNPASWDRFIRQWQGNGPPWSLHMADRLQRDFLACVAWLSHMASFQLCKAPNSGWSVWSYTPSTELLVLMVCQHYFLAGQDWSRHFAPDNGKLRIYWHDLSSDQMPYVGCPQWVSFSSLGQAIQRLPVSSIPWAPTNYQIIFPQLFLS